MSTSSPHIAGHLYEGHDHLQVHVKHGMVQRGAPNFVFDGLDVGPKPNQERGGPPTDGAACDMQQRF